MNKTIEIWLSGFLLVFVFLISLTYGLFAVAGFANIISENPTFYSGLLGKEVCEERLLFIDSSQIIQTYQHCVGEDGAFDLIYILIFLCAITSPIVVPYFVGKLLVNGES